MSLVKRGEKGSPISAEEYDAVVEQVVANQELSELVSSQVVGSEVLWSLDSDAAMVAKYDELVLAGKTPEDGKEQIIRTDFSPKQYFKWDSSNANKAVYSGRDVLTEATEIALGNTNLAISGDVAKYVNEKIPSTISDEVVTNIFDENYTPLLGYYKLDGTVAGFNTDTNWNHTTPQKVKQGTSVAYSGTQTPTNINQVVFFDVNGDYISGVIGDTDGSTIPPVGADTVAFSKKSTASAVCSFTSFTEKPFIESVSLKSDIIDSITSTEVDKPSSANSVRVLNEKIYSEVNIEETTVITDMFNILTNYYGYIRVSDGAISGLGTDTAWIHTEPKTIKAGDVITYSGTTTPTNLAQVAFYTESDVFISAIAGDSNGSAIAPQDGLVRFCLKATVLNSAMFTITEVTDKHIKEVVQENTDAISILKSEKKINTVKQKNYRWDVNHNIIYGQSLGQGDWVNTVISGTQKYNSLMFNGGIRTWEYTDQANARNTFVPAIEQVILSAPSGATDRGETPASGITEKLMQLIADEDGIGVNDQQYQVLVSAPGLGGLSIEALFDENGIYFQRLLLDVTRAKAIADSQGLTYGVSMMQWIQGENSVYNDMSQSEYYDRMVAGFELVNSSVKNITGQAEDVLISLYQTNGFDWYFGDKWTYPDVPLAQLQVCENLDYVDMATPIYHLPLKNNDVHFTPIGSKWFGGYFGIDFKRRVIDNLPNNSIKPISFEVNGNNIYVKFDNTFPFEFDTTSVIDRGVSKGFQIREPNDRAQNSYLDIITNVTVNKHNVIKIECSSSPLGKKLTYAMNGTGVNDVSSGNLRDTQPIKFSFPEITGGSDVEHDMFNWCPLFELIID